MGRSWEQFKDRKQCLDVPNYFDEIDFPFCSLHIVTFLIKTHVTCVAIFFKAYFLKLKKTYLTAK